MKANISPLRALLALALTCGLAGCTLNDVDSEIDYENGGALLTIDNHCLSGTLLVNGLPSGGTYEFTDEDEHVFVIEMTGTDDAKRVYYQIKPGKHLAVGKKLYTNPLIVTVQKSQQTVIVNEE